MPKPLREAAIEHAKEITKQNMLDSLDEGKKKKKKKRKIPLHVLDMGSPELSELGDTASFREEPIHIEFSAKEPSAEDRRFADVIRFKLACEVELKYGDTVEFSEEVAATKKDWLKANSLYKKLLQQRSLVTYWVKMMLSKILTQAQFLLLSTRIDLWTRWRQHPREVDKSKMMKMISQQLPHRQLRMACTACLSRTTKFLRRLVKPFEKFKNTKTRKKLFKYLSSQEVFNLGPLFRV